MATAGTYNHINPKAAKTALKSLAMIVNSNFETDRKYALELIQEITDYVETEGRAVEFAHTAYTSYREAHHKLLGSPIAYDTPASHWYALVQSELRACDNISSDKS
jgi:hypothetical protein